MAKKHSPIVLIIRDGWGYRKSSEKNAIVAGKPVFTENLMNTYPNTLLDASQEAVGLPKGYMGNSEVGHLTIGSGQVIKKSLPRINDAIKDKSFFSNKAFLQAITNAKKHNTVLHLIGLLQSEGVHSHEDHLFALLDLCKKEKFKNILIHVITDGRDAPVTDSVKHVRKLEKKLKDLGFGSIATISGRYFAMDRDKRWARTKKAYLAIMQAKGNTFTKAITAIKDNHTNNVTDEFIEPLVHETYTGVSKNDSIIFFNYRTDRPRQLTQAIIDHDFTGFARKQQKVFFVAMTNYYSSMNAKVAFPDIKVKNFLGQILSKHNIPQLRISETEKYAHVTFFFNGQVEEPFPGEDRILIPSPKVATYDLQPEMSVDTIAKRIVSDLKSKKHKIIITNLVNSDMVGHTGVWSACLKAVKAMDNALKDIVTEVLAQDGVALITADHGNMEDLTDKWRTSHTTNKVPFILISNDKELRHATLIKDGSLANIAPTILDLLKIKPPKEMVAPSLIK